jgi:hypothetical protein
MTRGRPEGLRRPSSPPQLRRLFPAGVIAHRGPDPCGLPDRARAIVSRYKPGYKTSEGARCVNAPSTHADPGRGAIPGLRAVLWPDRSRRSRGRWPKGISVDAAYRTNLPALGQRETARP